MVQSLSREIQDPEDSDYAITLAEISNFQAIEDSRLRIKRSELRRRGLEKNRQMIQEYRKLVQHPVPLQQLENSIGEILLERYPHCDPQPIICDFLECARKYPTYRTLSGEDKRCCGLALSFYSGPSELARAVPYQEMKHMWRDKNRWNQRTLGIESFLDFHFDSNYFSSFYSNEFAVISCLLKALDNLPTYSGLCVRALQLNQEEKGFYKEGKIFAMKKFNSSSKGDTPAPYFSGLNTRLLIDGRTGRDISKFSCFLKEREVLFPPGSIFIVTKKEIKDGITIIHLKEILRNTYVLVDEKTENKNYEYNEVLDNLPQESHHDISTDEKSSRAQFGQEEIQNKNLEVISILEKPQQNEVVDTTVLIELCNNQNSNVNPPFPALVVKIIKEASESLPRGEEAMGQDLNYQKKPEINSHSMQEGPRGLPFSITNEYSNLTDQLSLESYFSSSSTNLDLNRDSESRPESFVDSENGSLRTRSLSCEEFNKYP